MPLNRQGCVISSAVLIKTVNRVGPFKKTPCKRQMFFYPDMRVAKRGEKRRNVVSQSKTFCRKDRCSSPSHSWESCFALFWDVLL